MLTPPRSANRSPFAPIGLLLGTALLGFAFNLGTHYHPDENRTRSLAMNAANVPTTEVRPAQCLRMIGQSLHLRCGRSPDGTVVLDRDDVERVCRLAEQVCAEEKTRRAPAPAPAPAPARSARR
jgi:hypothetical protein